MPNEDLRRHSRWMIRALEWNDSRARYPNLWHEGMPCRILAFESMGSRLRLGDLIAVYHPSSSTYPKRSERFVGISRVIGMQRARVAGSVFVDLETAHRFGVQVHVWTIDDRAEMTRLLDLGVDGIMTDRPQVLKDLLVERGEWR